MRYKQILRAVGLALLVAFSVLTGAGVAGERVDINTADAQTLDRVLTNVGPAKAAAIIAYRDAHGPFRSAEELVLVRGIGLKTVEKNRDRIDVGSSAARRPAGSGGVLPRIVPVTP
ncbi:ComEA family DNA-binding protein [Lysobacter sp. SG-8]|uniref:ComEA family DNA-binding protein n=1 Tax=Marilutibacter penaei TaxID=2759900 RepID=A0A7W3U368_9GAMM|nr:ComEA family DNA-binding protein [Lysobacter penaei]MBB1088118.1 ComEA family DNA-binding protein [Lysobacter penaei]